MNDATNRTQPTERLRIAADIGGTFTDVALVFPDGRLATCKVPSTPHDYAQGVVDGILGLLRAERLSPSDIGDVLHACTVATNAILEGKGARTALLTTAGFRDVLEMRRIRVPRLYDPLYVKPQPLVPRRLRVEVIERMDAHGQPIVALCEASVVRAIETLRGEGVEAIAVGFLHAYANPAHENRVGQMLREAYPDAFVTLSSEVLPEIREYERISTTVINAVVGPPVARYLQALRQRLDQIGLRGRVLVMHSAGGVCSLETVLRRPAQIVECGPAAGVVGAQVIGLRQGHADLISFDMGGTTAKASLIEGGVLNRADEYEVGGGISLSSKLSKGGGYALKLPVIDISEVGTGGGSLVWVDRAGSLKVGPHSAGSRPGPACYGAGNTRPTVTDANVLLGYLNPTALAGGTVPINADLAQRAIDEHVAGPLGMDRLRAAFGVHEVANVLMTRAVKTVSTYRGRDPRDFAMIAFGGNGGIHAVPIARALGVRTVIVPAGAGVFSAIGLLAADVSTEASAALRARLNDVPPGRLQSLVESLRRKAADELGEAGSLVYRSLFDLRYAGQAFELTTALEDDTLLDASGVAALAARFEVQHQRVYGHCLPGATVEVVAVRVVARVRAGTAVIARAGAARAAPARHDRAVYFGSAEGQIRTPVIGRSGLDAVPRRGPFIIEEYEGTAVVPPDASARLDDFGNVVIALQESS